jgi:hypothetical protein
MGAMDEVEETPKTYPPGFEPPTDLHVPWYAWLLWPAALVTLLLLASLLFRGCMSGLS